MRTRSIILENELALFFFTAYCRALFLWMHICKRYTDNKITKMKGNFWSKCSVQQLNPWYKIDLIVLTMKGLSGLFCVWATGLQAYINFPTLLPCLPFLPEFAVCYESTKLTHCQIICSQIQNNDRAPKNSIRGVICCWPCFTGTVSVISNTSYHLQLIIITLRFRNPSSI